MTKKHGGKRKGAGRKSPYGCETVRVRIPIDLLPTIMQILEKRREQKPPPNPS